MDVCLGKLANPPKPLKTIDLDGSWYFIACVSWNHGEASKTCQHPRQGNPLTSVSRRVERKQL